MVRFKKKNCPFLSINHCGFLIYSIDFACSLARLSSTILLQMKTTVQEEADKVARLNKEHFQSRNWTIAHLRLGEMQILQILSGIGFSILRRMEAEQQFDKTATENTIREAACPAEYLEHLSPSL